MKSSLTCVLVVLAMASAMAATRRPKYSNSRARDAGAIMQGIGGLIGGLSEASARQRQQQQQQMLEQQRQQQAELQRQRLEAERRERRFSIRAIYGEGDSSKVIWYNTTI